MQAAPAKTGGVVVPSASSGGAGFVPPAPKVEAKKPEEKKAEPKKVEEKQPEPKKAEEKKETPKTPTPAPTEKK